MIRNLFIGIFMAVAAAGSWAQEAKEMVYPQAEWCKAGNILMHTPGQELFNGVIHPSAGLIDGFGAAHCMTQVLQREKFTPASPSSVAGIRAIGENATTAYRLDGTVADKDAHGIIIENGKKTLIRKAE